MSEAQDNQWAVLETTRVGIEKGIGKPRKQNFTYCMRAGLGFSSGRIHRAYL
jgi:hypothetical protein